MGDKKEQPTRLPLANLSQQNSFGGARGGSICQTRDPFPSSSRTRKRDSRGSMISGQASVKLIVVTERLSSSSPSSSDYDSMLNTCFSSSPFSLLLLLGGYTGAIRIIHRTGFQRPTGTLCIIHHSGPCVDGRAKPGHTQKKRMEILWVTIGHTSRSICIASKEFGSWAALIELGQQPQYKDSRLYLEAMVLMHFDEGLGRQEGINILGFR